MKLQGKLYQKNDPNLSNDKGNRCSHEIIPSHNSPIKNILYLAKKIALSEHPVLILGPTGVGKENLAHYIHTVSNNAEAPFVDINCAAVPEELFESELFGHVKGAFTGASVDRKGYMETTGSGTLFLDEIGEMPFSLQSKLLRVLETRIFYPVGSTESRLFQGRIVAATHRDLLSLVKKEHFREDLFYRLAVFSLEIPELSQRKDDIPLLINYFISRQKNSICFTEEAIEFLKEYSWPGNIRELRNLIDRISILSDTSTIDIHTLKNFFSSISTRKKIL